MTSPPRKSDGVVIFAHVPPPHHGQSRMVQLMLEGLPDRSRIFHVDARFSDGMADVGGMHPGKLFRMVRFCGQALAHRFFRGATSLYYIPAPAKRSALLRDIVAMVLLRPFFDRLILHWHAVGLGAWAQEGGPLQKLLLKLLQGADPAVVIAPGNTADARVFQPRDLVVLPNGIPDPCPAFTRELDHRRERSSRIQAWITGASRPGPEDRIEVLYLGHCTRSKGLFEALEGVRQAARCDRGLRWRLCIAGDFMNEAEKAEAKDAAGNLEREGVEVVWLGFLSGDDKARRYLDSDVLLFPSYSESFGLVAAEAFACGLPVIGTDIPGLQAVLGDTPCARVPVRDPDSVARALLTPSSFADPGLLRSRFASEFTIEKFQARLSTVLFGYAQPEPLPLHNQK